MLFKDDYHARQVFDFLRVETVHELEQFTPDEIFKRLTRPVAESVERIRRRLAEKKRYLSSDEDYMLAAIREAVDLGKQRPIARSPTAQEKPVGPKFTRKIRMPVASRSHRESAVLDESFLGQTYAVGTGA